MNRYGRTGWKGASGGVLLGCFSRKGSFRGRHHQFRQILPSWTRRRALMIDDWAVGAHCAGGGGRDPAKHAAMGAASTGGAGRSRAVHAGDDALVRGSGKVRASGLHGRSRTHSVAPLLGGPGDGGGRHRGLVPDRDCGSSVPERSLRGVAPGGRGFVTARTPSCRVCRMFSPPSCGSSAKQCSVSRWLCRRLGGRGGGSLGRGLAQRSAPLGSGAAAAA